MPFDATGLTLTVVRRGARRQSQHYPQLATQVRCSSGFTVVPSGRLEALRPVVRPVVGPATAVSAFAAEDVTALLRLLHSHARESTIMPTRDLLAEEMGPGWNARDVLAALQQMQAEGVIRYDESQRGAKAAWRRLMIVASGAVLRFGRVPGKRDAGR